MVKQVDAATGAAHTFEAVQVWQTVQSLSSEQVLPTHSFAVASQVSPAAVSQSAVCLLYTSPSPRD